MTPRKFHLGWFMNFTTNEWNTPFGNGGMPWNGQFYIEMAQAMETGLLRLHHDRGHAHGVRGLRRDDGGVPEVRDHGAQARPGAAGGDHRGGHLQAGRGRDDVDELLPARSCWPGCARTLDRIAEGRFGWNIVTSGEDGSAQNFGMDKLTEHDLRYDMADEYLDLVNQLWDSWEPDAVVRDRETSTYADFKKVRTIDFSGKYYKSRGPLNTVRSPQGRPAFVQAGGSPRGRAVRRQVRRLDHRRGQRDRGMKAYRDDVRARAEAKGRDPDDIKVLFVVTPVLGATEEEALAKKDARGVRSRLRRAGAGQHLVGHRHRLLQVRPRRAAAESLTPTASAARWTSSPSGAAARRCASSSSTPAGCRTPSSWSARPTGRRDDGRGDGGGGRRRLPHQRAVHAGQQAVHHRDLRRAHPRAAAPRAHPHRVLVCTCATRCGSSERESWPDNAATSRYNVRRDEVVHLNCQHGFVAQ